MKSMVTTYELSDAELLEKAASNKSSSPETEELQIEGTPFKAIKENGKWFAAWGQGKMTEDFETPAELLEWIENNFWSFMITVITMAMDSRDLYKMAQMKKHTEKMAKDREHTLHMEIERLKKEEELHEAV